MDRHELDAVEREFLRDGEECFFVRYCEDDGVRVVRKVPWTALPSGVHNLRAKEPDREISPDDDVVVEDGGIAAVGRFTVVASTWSAR